MRASYQRFIRPKTVHVGGFGLSGAPTLRGRVFGDSVTTLAMGPRILSHGATELLATVTFGYDADRIMNQLLTPLPTK